MSATEAGDGGRAEPIDVDYEPAGRGAARRSHARRSGISTGGALVLAAFAAVAGAAGGAVAPRVPSLDAALDRIAPDATDLAAPSTEAQALDSALAARIDQLESFAGAPLAAAAGAEAAAVGGQLMSVQSAMAVMQSRLDALPSAEQITNLTGEVQALRAEVPGLQERLQRAELASRASFAVAAAAEAAQASGGFSDAHAVLAAILPDDDNVSALAPLAQQGAPTRSELRARFAALELDIVRASLQAQAGAGLWGRVQATASQWITVRRVGDRDTTAGVLEQVQQRLTQDDLDGAVRQMERLRGASAQTAAPWLADARRRLEIESRIAAIRAQLAELG